MAILLVVLAILVVQLFAPHYNMVLSCINTMYNVHTEWQTFGQRKKIAFEEQVFAHFCDKKIIYFLVLLVVLLHIGPDRLLSKI